LLSTHVIAMSHFYKQYCRFWSRL